MPVQLVQAAVQAESRYCSTADAIVDGLKREGIDQVFGLPGLQSDPLFDAFHRAEMPVLHSRHEQAAGYMALGAALATGRPQVCSVVPGPGFLNASAALLTAQGMNAPVVALVGQIPQREIDRGHGHLHEMHDQLGLARHFCKFVARIRSPQEAPELVGEAFNQAASRRPGPVMLECAMDTLAEMGAAIVPRRRPQVAAAEIDAQSIARFTDLIAAARSPLIVVGGGAQGAAAEVTMLAERINAPVAGYRRGTGVLPSGHPLSVRLPVAHRVWARADVVIGIGTRLHLQQSMWGVAEDMRILRIDIDPDEPARFRTPAAVLIGDAAECLRALLDLVRARPAAADESAALAADQAWFEASLATLEPQVGFLKAIRAALPVDGIFVDEVTQVGFVSRLAFPVHLPRTFLSPGYQDNLGWGVGTALGVQAALPDRAVVAISGDGGFLYQVGELATAVQHKLPVVFVVFDNSMFGNVRRIQEERYGNRVIAADLSSPDFVHLAESFGVLGLRADNADELQRAVAQGLAARRPTLVHVPCGPMPSPWPYILMPKVR